MLSKGAFNALLKTIEEPKNNVCFIFATTEIHKVPDTIISRCQVFNYRKVPNKAMITHLKHIAETENLQWNETALEIIANISEGCVRDAVKYVDQVSILGELSEENISRFLGVAGEATLKKLLSTIKIGNREEIFTELDKISQQGIDLGQFAKQAISYLDQHLLEDTEFFLQCSEMFGEVLSTLRQYPYPLIAYKIAINKALQHLVETIIQIPTQKAEKRTEGITPPQRNESPQTNIVKEEQKVPESAKPEAAPRNEVAQISTTNVAPQVTSNETRKNEAPNVTTSPQSPTTESDFKALWGKVIAQLSRPTVQSNLKDQAIIEKKEGNQIFITVITSIADMLIKNEENKKQIEQFLSKELGETVIIQSTYEKKEDYFARKMGL